MTRQEYLVEIERVIAQGPYCADWDSLCEHETPKWFRDSKFGIFIHWGVYSVPAFENEWYPRNMYIQGSKAYEHHIKTYGPHKEFGYKDFVPLFKAEKFDAEKWVELFREAGAKYMVPVAEHHDGFQMYKSDLSHWNAVEKGPMRDVLGELAESARRNGMTVGASTHRIEHWFFMGHGREFDSDIRDPMTPEDLYWPSMPDNDDGHQDLFSEPMPTQEYLEDWMVRTCELIDRYHIRQLYFDWWIHHSSAKPYLQKIAAYYYNRAVEWGEEVMIAYKHDGYMFGTAVPDIERGKFAEVKHYPWQTDTAIAKNSWCYTENNDFKKAGDIVRDLVDIVSKNGCLLLNVGPKADGTFTEEDTAILREIGAWMKVNSEMIYGTRPYRVSSEGPSLTREGQFMDDVADTYTCEDFRFTVKGNKIYAACMAFPEDGKVNIRTFGINDAHSLPLFAGIIDNVEVLGGTVTEWSRTTNGLIIRTEDIQSDKPVVFRLTLR